MNHEIEQLQHFLATTDAPCPSCDYNLRGLKSDACPECNQKLVLNVALAEPRQRAFIAALVGLAMGAGFQGLLALYFVYWTFVRNRGMGEGLRFILLTAPFFVVEGAALLLLVYKRRPFQRRGNRFKACCVTLAWFVTIAGFAIFTALIK
jgi:hypothetical protein